MRVHVRVPASSANLGPGFDALGLALGLYNEITAEESDRTTATVEGEGERTLAAGDNNVVLRGVRAAYEAAGRKFRGATVRCVNRIPLARGLGSSAAAWVGGLVAGNALLDFPLSRDAIVALGARAEGHPDNVAAAVYGGLTVAAADGDTVRVVKVAVPPRLEWVALIPDVMSSTAQARGVLPTSVPRADAVFNVQRVALLVAALAGDRRDALATAFEDRLHEPYRLALFPWMPAVAAAARRAGALGCVLSGAGPALLAVVDGGGAAVARAMEHALAQAGVTGIARTLAVDGDGAIADRAR
jgi:homoserine kinase